jgi:hypothetical protein
MITDDLCKCSKCGYEKALTHYSNCNIINWIACPKCRTFFDHDQEVEELDPLFWENVEQDTGYWEIKKCVNQSTTKNAPAKEQQE